MHGEFPYVSLALDGDDGGVRALGDDDGSLPGRILLGQVGDVAGDVGDVVGVEGVGVGVGAGLGLVADEVVPVGGRLVERVLEELRDEGGAEAEGEDLVVGGGLLGERQNGGHAHRQVVAADVVHRRAAHERPDVRRLQMLELVFVGGGQVRAHAAVVAGDNDAAAAGRRVRVHAVFHPQPGRLARGPEDRRIFVGTDTADVEYALGREDVLFAGKKNDGEGRVSCSE